MASTGSQLGMEKPNSFTVMRKQSMQIYSKSFFSPLKQLKERSLIYSTSLRASSQREIYACLKIQGSLLQPALGEQTIQGCLLWHLPSCLQHNACLKIQQEKQEIKGMCHHLKPRFTGLQGKEQPNEILTEGATTSFHSAASQDALLCTAHQ